MPNVQITYFINKLDLLAADMQRQDNLQELTFHTDSVQKEEAPPGNLINLP